MIHHGVRTATGGAYDYKTPLNNGPCATMIDRKVDSAAKSIEVTLRYDEYNLIQK
jgi:hypothetical protein